MFLRIVDRCERASVQPPSERGIASWYGAPYHGQRSASGEIYDQEKLTAAHRTLPFGTRVRVHRVDRHESVVVRINDRGPFVKSRITDLSRAVAVRLGMTDGGVAPVIVEVVASPPLDPSVSMAPVIPPGPRTKVPPEPVT